MTFEQRWRTDAAFRAEWLAYQAGDRAAGDMYALVRARELRMEQANDR